MAGRTVRKKQYNTYGPQGKVSTVYIVSKEKSVRNILVSKGKSEQYIWSVRKNQYSIFEGGGNGREGREGTSERADGNGMQEAIHIEFV